MKRIGRKIAVLLAVFLAGVIGTVLIMDNETTDNLIDMEAPSLPEVMVQIGDTMANQMYGYRQEMQVDFMRDSLTPLDTSREIRLVVKPYKADIQGLSYEIRTSDGSKVVENGAIKSLQEKDSYLTAKITLGADKMLMNQEYSFRITLETGEGPVYYYTRIIQRSRLNADKYVQFVQSFYEKCTSKETAQELAAYVEPDDTVSNGSFTDVNIHSSMEMITWGALNPKITRKGIPTIKDINETTGSVSIHYQIAAQNNDESLELYEVTDFYRMRNTEARIMLLDFQRSAHQIFDGEHASVSKAGLSLGVTDRHVQYVANEEADIVAFVQEGDLWSYSIDADKITKIFSFRQEEADARGDYGAHDMKIVRVGESGDIDFVLYGYMNRGEHEGYMGVGVYHYSSEQNAVREQVFIPCQESYEFLRKDLERLSYISEKQELFILMSGSLLKVDLEKGSWEIIKEGINSNCFASSKTNARAAWMEEMDEYHSKTIKYMDFETGKTLTIQAPKGEYLKALGFMNEDLVYGMTAEENVVTDASGREVFAMDVINIQDFGGEVVKSYSQDGMYITQADVTDALMEIQLSAWENGAYVYKTSDNIMNNRKAKADTVTLNMVATERQKFISRLSFEESIQNDDPVVVYAKIRMNKEDSKVSVEVPVNQEDAYYIYASGSLQGVYADPAQAILYADKLAGVVLNRDQQYVWERGNKKTKMQMNESDIPKEILKGTLDPKVLQKELGNSVQVLNLTGCSLDNVLYEVSAQRPVVARTPSGDGVVIVGYDQYNTLLYDPKTGKTEYMGINDSTNFFNQAGNMYFTYIEKFKE